MTESSQEALVMLCRKMRDTPNGIYTTRQEKEKHKPFQPTRAHLILLYPDEPKPSSAPPHPHTQCGRAKATQTPPAIQVPSSRLLSPQSPALSLSPLVQGRLPDAASRQKPPPFISSSVVLLQCLSSWRPANRRPLPHASKLRPRAHPWDQYWQARQ